MVILTVAYISYAIYKAIIISYLEIRFKEYDTWDNYYMEIRTFDEARLTEVRKIWYKDNKYKIIIINHSENNGITTGYKWIDSNNKTIIQKEENGVVFKSFYPDLAEHIYEYGDYKNKFIYWYKRDEREKIKYILGVNIFFMLNNSDETKILKNNETIILEKNTIIPKKYIDKTNNYIIYKYYNTKLNCVTDEDVTYKEGL